MLCSSSFKISAIFIALSFGAGVFALSTPKIGASDRREFFSSISKNVVGVTAFAGGLNGAAPPAFAKSSSASLDNDKAKIVAGYKRLNYLLDNCKFHHHVLFLLFLRLDIISLGTLSIFAYKLDLSRGKAYYSMWTK